MMRAVHGSTVLYPSDATSTAALVAPWPTRRASSTCAPPAAPTPCSTPPARLPGRRLQGAARPRDDDQVTLVGAGVTLHDCLAAADLLAGAASTPGSSTATRSSRSTPRTLVAAGDGHDRAAIVVAEDHHPEGGLGSAVIDALLAADRRGLAHLAVRGCPGPERARSCSPGPASTASTSPPPHESWCAVRSDGTSASQVSATVEVIVRGAAAGRRRRRRSPPRVRRASRWPGAARRRPEVREPSVPDYRGGVERSMDDLDAQSRCTSATVTATPCARSFSILQATTSSGMRWSRCWRRWARSRSTVTARGSPLLSGI